MDEFSDSGFDSTMSESMDVSMDSCDVSVDTSDVNTSVEISDTADYQEDIGTSVDVSDVPDEMPEGYQEDVDTSTDVSDVPDERPESYPEDIDTSADVSDVPNEVPESYSENVGEGVEQADLSDYKVMVDGTEWNANADPLEGTSELIGHSELDDAYLANDMHNADQVKNVMDKMQMGDYGEEGIVALNGPIDDMEMMKNENAINEAEIEHSRNVSHWSRDSYTEEYNPEDFE